MENSDDIHAKRAITQLWACDKAIEDTTGAIRYMLDDVMIASHETDGQDMLTAWNQGRDHVNTHRKFVAKMVEETVDYMFRDDFMAIDATKRVDYWETATAAERNLDTIDAQLFFYHLLSQIEHTEQSIGFLCPRLEQARNMIVGRQLDGSLSHRGLALHKRRFQLLRDRLRYETHNVMSLISEAVNNPHFSSLEDQKQREYHAKWKAYANQLGEIDVD